MRTSSRWPNPRKLARPDERLAVLGRLADARMVVSVVMANGYPRLDPIAEDDAVYWAPTCARLI